MNMPNQPASEGSLNESVSKSKSNVRLFVFVVIAVHAVFFAGVLLQACKPKEEKAAQLPSSPPPPLDNPPPYAGGYQPGGNAGLPPGGPPPISLPPGGGIASAPGGLPPQGSPGGVALPPPPAQPAIVETPQPPPAAPPVAPVAPVAPAPVDSGSGPKQHAIAKGDSFSTLAKKYGVSAAAIAKANPDANPTKLKVGQKITIPAAAPKGAAAPEKSAVGKAGPGEYTVKSGDTLGKIAKAHKTSVKAIRDLNKLKTDQIKVGQKLTLPAGGEASTK